MMKLPHKKIGNYLLFTNNIVTKLRHSTIFLGIHMKNKKKVLIKIVSKANYQANDILRHSFDFEIQTMKKAQQQNILKYIQMIESQNNFYMILEWPEGQSYSQILKKTGPLSEVQVQQHLKNLKPTLQFLHKNDIIHGNIKSKSLLVHHTKIKLGYPSYSKIIQIIKAHNIPDVEFNFEENYRIKEEFTFLAPELLAAGIITNKHDIWSLGVVLYQALFGQLPWKIQDCTYPIQVASLILNQKVQFPKSSNVSKQMKHFLIRCLDTDPEKRFGWEQALDHQIFNKKVKRVSSQFVETDEHSTESVKDLISQKKLWRLVSKQTLQL